MAKERDYAHEWQREKESRKQRERMLGVKVTPKIAEDFAAKCEDNNTTKNAVLKDYIIRYTYEDFDQ